MGDVVCVCGTKMVLDEVLGYVCDSCCGDSRHDEEVHPSVLTEKKLNDHWKTWAEDMTYPAPKWFTTSEKLAKIINEECDRAELNHMKETLNDPIYNPMKSYAPWSVNDPHIGLRGGRKFHYLRFKPSDIFIEDIAHSLSRLCRFNGYTAGFYSVAQHSVHVSTLCKDAPLWGLLHDAAEAYIGDIVRPWKSILLVRDAGRLNAPATIRQFEQRIQIAIAVRFALPWPMPECVHQADEQAGKYEEDRALVDDWICWTPQVAKAVFLERFKELGGKEC